jgi:hypothetical protein
MTKKILNIPQHKTVASTPSTPDSGYSKIYVKSDGCWYRLDASGNEFPLGGGGSSIFEEGGGAGSTYRIDNGNAADGICSTISGGFSNLAGCSVHTGATVGGGGCNVAFTNYATISGGYCNTASCYGATIGGGQYNRVDGSFSVIAGGGGGCSTIGNRIGCAAAGAVISGGAQNLVLADNSTISGGGGGAPGQGNTINS